MTWVYIEEGYIRGAMDTNIVLICVLYTFVIVYIILRMR
jgi:hypothetical protein